MPGGFHPFHAGHAALYNSARKAFPDAEVFVAATNDTSNRPFPFAIKEKLAKLAGVEAGHFVQVKSPFQAREITANLNPEQDQLIFVRSEKDAGQPPRPGGVKKDGNPAYLQPLAGNEDNLMPLGKHAYMAYLPTVEFGPGMTSATEIRTAWPRLNEKRKTALVMSLYPKTQRNPALAANVVKMLDTAMGGKDQGVTEVNELPGKDKVQGATAMPAPSPALKRILMSHIDELREFVKYGELDPTGDLFFEVAEHFMNEIPIPVRQDPLRLERRIRNMIAPYAKFYATAQNMNEDYLDEKK